eukprot:619440-Pleurochrysis_carterae.AAC.2
MEPSSTTRAHVRRRMRERWERKLSLLVLAILSMERALGAPLPVFAIAKWSFVTHQFLPQPIRDQESIPEAACYS